MLIFCPHGWSMSNILGNMKIKVHFGMTLTFDFEDHICILFFAVDYLVVLTSPTNATNKL